MPWYLYTLLIEFLKRQVSSVAIHRRFGGKCFRRTRFEYGTVIWCGAPCSGQQWYRRLVVGYRMFSKYTDRPELQRKECCNWWRKSVLCERNATSLRAAVVDASASASEARIRFDFLIETSCIGTSMKSSTSLPNNHLHIPSITMSGRTRPIEKLAADVAKCSPEVWHLARSSEAISC